jgi:ABC-type molybdate transport system substrate-binding protein
MSIFRTKISRAVTTTLIAPALFAASLAHAAINQEQFFPPWSHGANNPVQTHGLEFTVPEVDNLPDFHGDPCTAKLVVFVGGNYFFAMAPLVTEFIKEHPEFKEKVYYETIPPGLLVDQIKHNGTITVGNMTWTVHADVYAGGLKRVNGVISDGYAQGPAVPYATNTLTIMVPKGNPAHITGLTDLGKPGVRLVMPNPAFEGIGRQIKASLAKAGGEDLVTSVYTTKVNDGETLMTHIHHRQSPLDLMLGRADAGVTWQSEAIFQEEAGNPIGHVAIPDDQNATAIYAAVALKAAPHRKAAQMWVDYLRSPQALAIFEHYGFKPYSDKK